MLSGDTSYLKTKALTIGVVTVFLAGVMVCWFHVSVKYVVGRHVIEKLQTLLASTVAGIQNKRRQYIKDHFYDVTRAAEFYSSKLFDYFDQLIGKAGQQERALGRWRIFVTWFSEFLLMFLLCLMLLYWTYHM